MKGASSKQKQTVYYPITFGLFFLHKTGDLIMDQDQQRSRLKELIARGKEQGFLTYADVNDHLPPDIADPEQIEDIISMINDMGIRVAEVAPEADELLLIEQEAADEVAEE